jgi:hypothetical protein
LDKKTPEGISLLFMQKSVLVNDLKKKKKTPLLSSFLGKTQQSPLEMIGSILIGAADT